MHYAILITVRHIVNLAFASLLPKKKPSSHSLSLLIECQIPLIPYTTPQQQ